MEDAFPEKSHDVAIVGGGAAGLATAIFTSRLRPDLAIVVLDGAAKVGAKILVSGGGRCNVTHETVTVDAYFGGSRNAIRKVLAALPVARTIAFFREIGVALHREENGKLFPDSNTSRTVLAALLDECDRLGVRILTSQRVAAVHHDSAFALRVGERTVRASALVLATGGKSLPKTGSDGSGYALAESFGHTIVPTTPALSPLLLDGDFHASLAGVTQNVELRVSIPGAPHQHVRGSMLWTHFGVSGPAAMNISRIWHRARLERHDAAVTANFLVGEDFESAERAWMQFARDHPRGSVANAVAARLPARVADAVIAALGLDGQTQLAQLTRDQRRSLLHRLLSWPLPVRDSRGYSYAEATAGGVELSEVDPATMQSRKQPGLFIVGEMLDVDGLIGGFNFQWAWSSGFVAAAGIARLLAK